MSYYGVDFWYLVLVVPAIILSLIASASVKSTYAKYAKIASRRGITGSELAFEILRRNGIYDISVGHVSGNLTDHFSPKEKIIRLSDGVYGSTSIAALGIAAHEAGHVVQYHTDYAPISLRNFIYPAVNIGSSLSIPLVILGLIFGMPLFTNIGIALFIFVVAFQVITLPVEFNASKRAMKSLEDYGILASDELPCARKVLTAAAMTYVASLAVSLAQLLRLILMSRGRRR